MSPLPLSFSRSRMPVVFLFFHMVEDPVPHDEQAGDDHISEQSCAEESPDDDEFIVHDLPLIGSPRGLAYPSAGTPSAQVSIQFLMPSSS